nr:MAG TPA: hypothetical protein [Bacteriophage sp.]
MLQPAPSPLAHSRPSPAVMLGPPRNRACQAVNAAGIE